MDDGHNKPTLDPTLTIIDQERHRLGRALHNDLGQCLIGVSLILANLERQLGREHPEQRGRLADVRGLVKEATSKLRFLSHGLQGVDQLGDSGFGPVLEALAADVAATIDGDCSFELDPAAEPIPEALIPHLYAFAFDLAAHAAEVEQISSIRGAVRRQGAAALELELTLDQPAAPVTTAPALAVARARAAALGAALEQSPTPDGGQRLVCTLPVELEGGASSGLD